VKQWAERALPVFEQVRDELHKSTDDFRKVMRPEQRAKLEVEVFKHRAGLQFAENKLRHWSQGNIDPDDVWEPVGESRQERRERRRAKEAEVEAAVEAAAKAARPTDQISQELDSWAQYTEAFIAAYELNEAQRTTVLSCLKELQERATTHREAHRKEIDELEKRIEKEAKADAEQAAIKEELVRLYGPVDTMFGELKTRLAAVLTSEQRAKGEFKFPPDRNEPEDERTPSPAEKTERRQGD
jgi:chromosome segregation ATPase